MKNHCFLRKTLVSIALSSLFFLPITTIHAQNKNISPAVPNIELGSSYFQAGRLDVALEEAQKALQKDSSNSDAYNLIGSIYLQSKELDKAQEALTKSLQISPQNPDAHNNMGLLLCEQSKTQEALQSFGKALSTPNYPKTAQTLINAGICLQKANDYVASEKYLVKALEIQPFLPLALYHLSISYLKEGKLDLAQSRIEAIHKQMAPNASTLSVLGTIAQLRGNTTQAQKFFERVVRLFPQSPEAQKIQAGQALF